MASTLADLNAAAIALSTNRLPVNRIRMATDAQLLAIETALSAQATFANVAALDAAHFHRYLIRILLYLAQVSTSSKTVHTGQHISYVANDNTTWHQEDAAAVTLIIKRHTTLRQWARRYATPTFNAILNLQQSWNPALATKWGIANPDKQIAFDFMDGMVPADALNPRLVSVGSQTKYANLAIAAASEAQSITNGSFLYHRGHLNQGRTVQGPAQLMAP